MCRLKENTFSLILETTDLPIYNNTNVWEQRNEREC